MRRKTTFLRTAIIVLFLILFTQPGTAWGQNTTVSITSFSTTSGSIDTHISYAAYKGQGTTEPAISSNWLRIYKPSSNSDDGTGGYVKITAASGYKIKSVTVTNADDKAGTIKTKVDNGSLSDGISIAKKATHTVNNITATDVYFYNCGSDRLSFSAFSVTYQSTSPSCSVSPTSWGFGDVQVGQTASKTFTVTTANLTGALTLSAGDGAFSVTSPSPATIAQNATTTQVTVTFTPSAVTSYNGNLTISGGGLANNVTVALTGAGTCATNTLAYPSTNIELSIDEPEVTLIPTDNTGNGGAITYTITDGDTSEADVDNDGYFYATAPGTWVVTATQEANGNYCSKSIDITITVLSNDPSCTVTPDSFEFGIVLVNTEHSQEFTVTTANLTGALTVAIDNTDKGFSVSPSSIAQNATSTTVTVTYNPTQASDEIIATLSISGGGLGTATEVLVSGTASAGHTIAFDAGTGTCATTSMTNLVGATITLPTASPSDFCAEEGWRFAGWAAAEVTIPTTTAPTLLTGDYTITNQSPTTLYAVYKEGQEPFDNTTTGDWSIYATVTANNNSTNYYAVGTGSKISSTTTVSNADVYTFEKPDGYGNGEYAIKTGSTYITYSSSADLGTSEEPYKWTISYGTKGTWRVSSQTSGRALIFSNGANPKVFGGYATSNVTANQEYYDIEIGLSDDLTYYSNPSCLEKVKTPTFNPVGGSYSDIKNVTISCLTDGATIYYTTDGTNPTTESLVYTSAITVDETMTIKAMATHEGMNNSKVASATYTITTLYTMQAIYNKASAIGTTASNVTVTFNNWVVSGVTSSTAYVTDNAGKGFIIYKSSHGFAVNDILSGTVSNTPLKLYNGSAEFTNLTSTTTGLTVTKNGTVTPVTMSIGQITGGVNTGALITLNNVKYDGTYLEDPNDSSIETKPYNGLGYSPSFTINHNYNVTGIHVQYNNNKQIAPRSAADIVEVEYDITLTQPQTGGTIGTSGDITTAKYGQEVTLTSTPADHYRLGSWTVMNGETPVAVNNNKFTMPKAPVTVTATFVQLYDITIDDDIEHGTVSVVGDVTEAAENDNIALTVTPESGYALKTLTVYKTGDTETTVTVTNNAFTMPAYAVTVTAEFSAEYTVTYYRNAVNDDDTAELTYGEGADVTILAYDETMLISKLQKVRSS